VFTYSYAQSCTCLEDVHGLNTVMYCYSVLLMILLVMKHGDVCSTLK